MKNKKLLVAILAIAVVVLGVVVAVIAIRSGENGKNQKNDIPDELVISNLEINAKANGIEVLGAHNIAGIFVEDGSDEVMENIFTVDFENNSEYNLQYAEVVLTIDGEEYLFKLSTIPAGEKVRAMEANRKTMPSECKECEMDCKNIAWFVEETSVHSDAIEIIEQDGGLVVKNISSHSISAPIYVYYKNYTDGIYVGGITYRATVSENIEAGQVISVGATHFAIGYSKIMFVDYAG